MAQPNYQCPYCRGACRTKTGLEVHKRWAHKEEYLLERIDIARRELDYRESCYVTFKGGG